MIRVRTLIKFNFQKLLLFCSYWFFRLNKRRNDNHISWVVGVDEIAAQVKYLARAIPNAYSVCLNTNKYYRFEYNFIIEPSQSARLNSLKSLIVGPLLLGFLLNRTKNFLYIGSTGFLISQVDHRNFEFKFIKSKNKHIVCFFVGNDIRAPRLMLKFAHDHKIEVTASYYYLVAPERLTESYDLAKRKLAEVSETYADMIFNAPTDQMAYFTKDTQPFIYFYPDENFVRDDVKFENLETVKIIHAPTSPIVKGTQLVRAAITRLQREGYNFEYHELMGVCNTVVLQALRSAHIVLNEFYALVPGLFGVEAMAAHCALMTSADETIERALPPGSNSAWFVTKNYEIYDNLKMLLDAPTLMKKYADAGYEWACKNASIKCSARKLSTLLLTIGSADFPHQRRIP